MAPFSTRNTPAVALLRPSHASIWRVLRPEQGRKAKRGIKGGESDNVVVIADISYRTWRKFNVQPDDEHRVFYVAVTRAKKNLFLLQPETKYSYELR